MAIRSAFGPLVLNSLIAIELLRSLMSKLKIPHNAFVFVGYGRKAL